jgi:hypothetical protein
MRNRPIGFRGGACALVFASLVSLRAAAVPAISVQIGPAGSRQGDGATAIWHPGLHSASEVTLPLWASPSGRLRLEVAPGIGFTWAHLDDPFGLLPNGSVRGWSGFLEGSVAFRVALVPSRRVPLELVLGAGFGAGAFLVSLDYSNGCSVSALRPMAALHGTIALRWRISAHQALFLTPVASLLFPPWLDGQEGALACNFTTHQTVGGWWFGTSPVEPSFAADLGWQWWF